MSYSAPLPIKALRGFKVVAALSYASILTQRPRPRKAHLRRQFLNNEGGGVCSFVSPRVWCVFLWRAPCPALAPRCLCWACCSVGGFRSRPRRRGLLSSSSGCVLFVRVLCLFFPLFFLRGVLFFRIFVSGFQFFPWLFLSSLRLLPWWLLAASRLSAACSRVSWSLSLRGLAPLLRAGWRRRVLPSLVPWSVGACALGRWLGRSHPWSLVLGACRCCPVALPLLVCSSLFFLNFF